MKEILLLFSLLFFSRKESLNLNLNNNLIKTLDTKHTKEKMKVLRKIAPSFPEEYIPIVNKSMLITEKIISLNQVMTFIATDEPFTAVEPIYIENNKERLNYIISTLKEEVPNDNIQSMTSAMEFVLNIDKYQKMIATFNEISSNPKKLDDIDTWIDLMEPFMEGKSDEQKAKLMEMTKMLRTMNLLEPSSKNNNSTSKKNPNSC